MRLATENFRKQGIATAHDMVVSDALAEVLSGGEADLLDSVTEKSLLELERRTFMRLIRTRGSIARVEHMLETGKPLRN